jgi:DNA-binding NarL/FixJ family response regulator
MDMPKLAENDRPIRIIVADDHPVVLDGLVAILETQKDFQVVAQSSNGKELVGQVEDLQPDIVLLDLEMPEMDGVAALHELRGKQSPVPVLVFTAYDSDDRILNAVQAGAKGYLLKGAPREEIFRAIRVVSQGGSTLEPLVASRLMQHIAGEAQGGQSQSLVESMTTRELEVLQLVARGLTNKEIAAQLVVTERTVKFHVSSILRKLAAGNRTEAVRSAINLGLIQL